jgi:hypothetical protein
MKRYTLTFSEEFEELLASLAEAEGISKADVLRNSAVLYRYLDNELSKGKRKLAIIDEEERVIKEIVLPAMLRYASVKPPVKTNGHVPAAIRTIA